LNLELIPAEGDESEEEEEESSEEEVSKSRPTEFGCIHSFILSDPCSFNRPSRRKRR
jgi:hypothetical protein